MKQTYENNLSMFETVRDVMNAHTTDTAGVPAIATAVTALSSLITQIDAAGTSQAAPLTGIAEDKEVARTALEEAVFVVSEPLSALAASANNNTLLDEVAISRSGLDHLSADGLDTFATRVAARGTTNQTVLTGTYGVTVAQVTAITTARTTFAPWVNKTRTAVVERSAVTASIPALDRQAKLLLRGQLDPLMNRFRLTNPTLYAAYRAARTVVDRHGAGGTPAALEIAAVATTGTSSAKLTYATAGGAGAVTITVQWKLAADADFGHDASVVRPEQTLANGSWAGATVSFRTKAVDAGGNAVFSDVKSVAF